MLIIRYRRRGLLANDLPAHSRYDCDNENDHQQVDQVDFAEQTAFFINNFHVCLQYLWIWLILRRK